MLVTASNRIRRKSHLDENLHLAIGVEADQVPQCTCTAHECLKEHITKSECDNLKSIIRSVSLKTSGAGTADYTERTFYCRIICGFNMLLIGGCFSFTVYIHV